MALNVEASIPFFARGGRLQPQHLAGMLGLPYVNNVFYVDPSSGSDANNSGGSFDNALATVGAAFEKCTSGKHDVIVIAPTGGTGRTTETGVITWNKRFTHLVGSGASPTQNIRAGMNAPALSAGVSFLDITENGCVFANLTIAGFNDVDELVEITGDYNSFHNVHFAGQGNTNAATTAATSSLHLTGGSENTFYHCTFGLDTVSRSGANFNVEFESAAERNVFEDCRFLMQPTADTPFFLKLEGTNAIERWIEFKNCSFYAFWINNADDITAAFETSEQTATGHILLTGNTFLEGATDWEASASGMIRFNNYDSTGATATMGIALTNT